MNDNQTIRRKTIGSPIRAGNQSESPVQSQQIPADMTMQRRKSVYVPGSKASDPTELENRIKISNWKNDIEGCRVQEQKWKDKIGQEAQIRKLPEFAGQKDTFEKNMKFYAYYEQHFSKDWTKR